MSLPRMIAARDLPLAPLDAAAQFTAHILPSIRTDLASDCIILFDPADRPHAIWRRAMVEELAREAAPARINAIVGTAEDAIAATVEYLAKAPGVTGQIFELST